MSNLRSVQRDLIAAGRGMASLAKEVLREAGRRIGLAAVRHHMRQAGPGARYTPNQTHTLRIVGGRLARSLTERGGALSGDAIQDVEQVSDGRFVLTKGSRVPYAAAHEYGASFSVPVTERMRGFFWHQHALTGKDKWRNMALSSKGRFNIRIPKRPYLEPALTDELPQINADVEEGLLSRIRRVTG